MPGSVPAEGLRASPRIRPDPLFSAYLDKALELARSTLRIVERVVPRVEAD